MCTRLYWLCATPPRYLHPLAELRTAVHDGTYYLPDFAAYGVHGLALAVALFCSYYTFLFSVMLNRCAKCGPPPAFNATSGMYVDPPDETPRSILYYLLVQLKVRKCVCVSLPCYQRCMFVHLCVWQVRCGRRRRRLRELPRLDAGQRGPPHRRRRRLVPHPRVRACAAHPRPNRYNHPTRALSHTSTHAHHHPYHTSTFQTSKLRWLEKGNTDRVFNFLPVLCATSLLESIFNRYTVAFNVFIMQPLKAGAKATVYPILANVAVKVDWDRILLAGAAPSGDESGGGGGDDDDDNDDDDDGPNGNTTGLGSAVGGMWGPPPPLAPSPPRSSRGGASLSPLRGGDGSGSNGPLRSQPRRSRAQHASSAGSISTMSSPGLGRGKSGRLLLAPLASPPSVGASSAGGASGADPTDPWAGELALRGPPHQPSQQHSPEQWSKRRKETGRDRGIGESNGGGSGGGGGGRAPRSAAAPVVAAAERRFDPNDGQPYTRDEFERYYGEASWEWESAARVPEPEPHAGQEPKEESRKAKRRSRSQATKERRERRERREAAKGHAWGAAGPESSDSGSAAMAVAAAAAAAATEGLASTATSTEVEAMVPTEVALLDEDVEDVSVRCALLPVLVPSLSEPFFCCCWSLPLLCISLILAALPG